jgi:hypothetical protein
VSITTAKLSATQIVACDVDWIAEARRLRTDLERLFKTVR